MNTYAMVGRIIELTAKEKIKWRKTAQTHNLDEYEGLYKGIIFTLIMDRGFWTFKIDGDSIPISFRQIEQFKHLSRTIEKSKITEIFTTTTEKLQRAIDILKD